MTFDNEGDEVPGVPAADIVFVIGEKEHAHFKREGNDLVFTAKVKLADALAGGRVAIHTLDGRVLTVPLTDVVTPGSVKVLRGEGMPISKSGGREKGDLHVKFDVVFPSHLSDDKKRAVRAALE